MIKDNMAVAQPPQAPQALFVAPSYYPNIGGVQKHLHELTLELVKDGYNITIFTVKKADSEKSFEVQGNCKIFRLNRFKSGLFNRFYIIFQFYKNINVFLKADIIHFHDYITFWAWGIYLYPLLKLAGKKVFITFHGWEGDFPPRKSIILKRKICQMLTQRNMCIGHYIEKWYGTKANIVSYGGVSKAESFIDTDNYILFVGRLEHDTGIKEYIKSWKTLSLSYPELKFIIMGDGSLKQDIQDYIIVNDIKNIEIKGFIPDPEIYLAKSRVVFATGYLSMLEAFSYKKPVIAYYNNSLKEDYLKMIPCSNDMFWLVKDFYEIIKTFDIAIIDTTKIKKAYEFSLDNTWENLKHSYYKLWGIN